MDKFFEDDDLDFGLSKPKKVYRGAFNYLRANSVYSEEAFEVWRDRKEMTYNYVSEIHSRVSTGELLKVFINYQVGKDFIPVRVVVKKDLGKEKTEETYSFNSKKNILDYQFKNRRVKEKLEISTPPRFHIATPAACCSMMFILTKKFDSTGKNLYSVFTCDNKWDYESPPEQKSLALERVSITSESVMINEQEVQAIQYRLYEDPKNEDHKNIVKPPGINVWLSRHIAIPYSLTSDDGTKITVKYLNHLESED